MEYALGHETMHRDWMVMELDGHYFDYVVLIMGDLFAGGQWRGYDADFMHDAVQAYCGL